MARADSLDSLIGTIYDAALDPALWETVLRGMAHVLGAGRVFLVNQDLVDGVVSYSGGHGFDSGTLTDYQTWGPQDPGVVQLLRRRPVGKAAATNLYFSDRDWNRFEYTNEFAIPHRFRCQLGVRFSDDAQRFSYFGSGRALGEPPFGVENVQTLDLLAPHLKRAFQIGRQFAAVREERAVMASVLDRARIGIVLLGEDGRVVFANRQAEALLGAAAGKGLCGATIHLQDPARQMALCRLVQEAVATGKGLGTGAGGVVPLSGYAVGERLLAHVFPFSTRRKPFDIKVQRVCAVAFLFYENAGPRLPVDLLRTLYGLTLAEARLAQALAKGRTLADIADSLGLSKETLRAQLKALFGKTGTRRQAELVRLLATLSVAAPQSQPVTDAERS